MEGTATPSSGSATTGPATFEQAFAADAPSASTPSTDTQSTASASADATVPPADDATAEGQPQQPGEPPRERWPDILENARKKASEDTLAQWREQHGWAEQINREQFQQAAQWYQQAAADPVAFAQQLISELTAHPQYSQQLRSLAAKTLAQRSQQAGPQAPDLTPIPVQLEDGRTVPLYTADHIKALKEQWTAELDQKYAPALQTAQELKAQKEQAAREAQAGHFASTFYSDLQKLPGFKEHEPQIKAKLASLQLTSDHPAEVRAAVYQAYHELVLPTLGKQAQSELLENLQNKAHASSTVNPGSAGASSPRPVRSFHDPSLRWS